MNAALSSFNGIASVELGERPMPSPSRGQVLIRTAAASINPRDWLLAEGRYLVRHFLGRPPIVLGSDASGTVVSVGSGVSDFEEGDEVFGINSRMGAFAEYSIFDAASIAKKPVEVSHAEAAGVPCAGLTALQSLVLAEVKQGSRVVVNGASGGVGSYAVQIAKILGAEVIAVASGRNEALCRELGADIFVDYKTDDFTITAGEVDVVLDAIGRSSLAQCSRILRRRGHYVTTIPSGRTAVETAWSRIRSGFGLFPAQRAHVILVRGRRSDLERLADWMARGELQTIIHDTHAFEDVREALQSSRTWRTRGKIILERMGTPTD